MAGCLTGAGCGDGSSVATSPGKPGQPAVTAPTAAPSNGVPAGAAGEDASALVKRADDAMQAGRFEEALKLYEGALKQNAEDEEAHFNAGFISARLGRTNEAILHYQ